MTGNTQKRVNPTAEDYQGRQLVEGQNGIYQEYAGIRPEKVTRDQQRQYALRDVKVPESYEELIKKPDIKVVDIRTSYGKSKKNIENGLKASGVYNTPIVNKDTGEKIFFNAKGVSHSINNDGNENIYAAEHIAEIIENAVLGFKQNEDADHPNLLTDKIYVFWGAVRGKDGILPVKLMVKEYDANKYSNLPENVKTFFEKNGSEETFATLYDNKIAGKILNVEDIEIAGVISHTSQTVPQSGHRSGYKYYPATISIADLLKNVNEDARKYLPESKEAYTTDDGKTEDTAKTQQRKTALKMVNAESGQSQQIYRQIMANYGFGKTMSKMDDAAKRMGREVVYYADDSNSEGYYKDGKIYLNVNNVRGTNQGVWSVFKHELTHSLEGTVNYNKLFGSKEWLSVANKTLINNGYVRRDENGEVIFDESGNELADVELLENEIRERYRRNNASLGETDLNKEITAYLIENSDMFTSEESINALVSADVSLGKRILNVLKGWIKRFAGTEYEKDLINAERMYLKAIEQAGRGEFTDGRFSERENSFARDNNTKYNESKETNAEVRADEREEIQSERREWSGYNNDREKTGTGTGSVSIPARSGGKFKGLYERGSGETVYVDNSGRSGITESDREKLKGTAVVDENNEPIEVYHFTPEMNFTVFDKGDTGFHFGSMEQANKRGIDKKVKSGRMFKAFLDIKNPIRARYDISNWRANAFATYLKGEGILNEDEYVLISTLGKSDLSYNSLAAKWLRKILKEKGYDGLIYPNGVEGDGESYMVFDDSQIIGREVINYDVVSEEQAKKGLFFYEQNEDDKEYSFKRDEIGTIRGPNKKAEAQMVKIVNERNKQIEKAKRIKEKEEKTAKEKLQKAKEREKIKAEKAEEKEYEKELKEEFRAIVKSENEKAKKEEISKTQARINSTVEKMLNDPQEAIKEFEKLNEYEKAYEEALSSEDKASAKTINAKLKESKRIRKEYRKRINEKDRKAAQKALARSNEMKDKKNGIQYELQSMERNVEDITKMISKKDGAGRDNEIAKFINETYFEPIHKNEADKNRFKTKIDEKVKALKLDTKEKYMVSTKDARTNIPIMRKISESGLVQMYAEGMLNTKDLMEAGADVKKIKKAAKEFRTIYEDIHKTVNEVLVRNGYPPIGYIKNYMPHHTEIKPDTKLGKAAGIFGIEIVNDNLPTDIAGLTSNFRPNKRWVGNFLERRGVTTDYDALKNFDAYIGPVLDVIYHTDDIRKLRAFENEIRYKYSDEGVREQIEKIKNDDVNYETEEKKQNAIEELYKNGGITHLNNFVQEIRNYTDTLAGKKNVHDRSNEKSLNRSVYRFINSVQNKVSKNMVAGNISSAVSNFVPLVQVQAVVGADCYAKALKDAATNVKKSDHFTEKSDFLINRRGSDVVYKTFWDKIEDKVSIPFTAVDDCASEIVTRSFYYDGLKKGMNADTAMTYADKYAARLMGDRSKGALPTVFNIKNPIWKLFTVFQVEVNNQYAFYFKDMPELARRKASSALAVMLFKLFIYSWIANDLSEEWINREFLPDIIGTASDFSGDLTGIRLNNICSIMKGLVSGEGVEIFEYGESSGVTKSVINFAENIGKQIPFIGGLLGGGRISISGAMPNLENTAKAGLGLVSGEMDSKKALSELGKEVRKPIWYIVLPTAGGQIKKMYETRKTIKDGGEYTYDSKGEPELKYAVEDTTIGEKIKAYTFGKSSLPAYKDYMERGFKALSAEQTKKYHLAVEAGISYPKYMEALAVTKGLKSDKDENGNSIGAGTKAEKQGKGKSLSLKTKEAIDGIEGLNKEQREVLYDAMGVSTKVW